MPAPYSAGSIFLQVVPSFRGVPEQIAREAREWPDKISDGFDEKLEKNVRESGKKAGKALGDELAKGTTDAGKAAGDNYTGAFRESIRKGISKAQRELNSTPLKLAYNDDGLRKTLDKVRADFAALDKKVKLGLDAGGAIVELRRITGVLDDVQKKAQNVELRTNVASVHKDLVGVEKHIQSLSGIDIEPNLKVNERQLGAFERRLKAGISAALESIPPLTLDDGKAYAQVEALRERLHSLDRDVELGVDSGQLFAELTAIEAAFHEIADTGENMKLRVDGASGFKTVAAMRAEIESLSRMTITPEIDVDRQLGAFERGFKGAIDNALRDLGAVDFTGAADVNTSAGQRAVADLRESLFNLGDLRLGVDISAETAREELRRIRDQLEQLQREHWDVRLDADTAAASGQISAFLAALEAIDHEEYSADVEVKGIASVIANLRAASAAGNQTDGVLKRLSGSSQDGANSFRAFNIRVLGIAALAPLVVPALGMIAAGIAALGPLAATGAAGIGVLTLGLFGIGDAFKAMGDARDSSAKDTADYAKAVRSASNSVVDAQRGVADAERGVAQARESAARSNEAAARQVENALRGQEDAERNLRGAQEDAEAAQRDLIRAREDAAEQLEDLQLKTRDGALDERQAVLDLREAERDLAKARADGVQGDELEQYILDLDKAKLRVDQTKEANGDLAAEQAKWIKGGIEGSDVVVAAHERIQSAQEKVADAERGLLDAQRAVADARAEQARTAVDGQRAIADAQRSVGDAQRGLSEAQVAYGDALVKTTSSQDKLKESMAKLGPAGQEFVRFLDGLRSKMAGLRAIAQAGLLPGLQDWISSMVNYHGPLLESAIAGISGAIGQMFSAFGQSIRGNAFTELFEMIDRSGPTFIRQLGDVLVNLGEGVASLIVAMEPLGHLFGRWLVEATERFSAWAASLKGSTGLQDFFGWVERVGPKVAAFFWEAADALRNIGIAVAPFAERMLDNLTDFFDWISRIDPKILGPIAVGILGVVVALQAIFGLTAMAHSFKSAFHLVFGELDDAGKRAGGMSAGFRGLGGSLGILGLALGTIYTQSDVGRAAINDIMESIGNFVGMIVGWIPNFTSLASAVGLAFAAFKLGGILGQGLGILGGAAKNAAPHFGLLVAGLTGSSTMAGRASTAMSNFGGVLSKFGGLLPFVGLGLGLIGAVMESNARRTKEAQDRLYSYFEASSKGGQKAAEAAKKMKEYAANLSALQNQFSVAQQNLDEVNVTDPTGSQDALGEEIRRLKKDLEEATKLWKEYWESLTPKEQAQANVIKAQNDLQYVLKDHAANSDAAKGATDRLREAERIAAAMEGTYQLAISGVNIELLKRQQIAIDTAGAQIAYEQSVAALADTHKRYQDVLADPNHTEEQARQAMEAWTNQAKSTADAAKRLSDAKYADADANVRNQMGNAALLQDLERQKGLYGELPPVLEELRQSLADSVPEAYKVAAGFEALQLEISETPSDKGIIVTSTTQEQRDLLSKLGYEVNELPNGEFEVTALTDDAKTALDDLVKPRTIEITANVATKGTQVSKPGKNNDYAYTPGVGGVQGGRATGGVIFGPGTGTSDSIVARLSNGEFVVKASSVNKYGLGFLNDLNAGRLPAPGYRDGGLVGLPKFAEGGYVASYGGTINLSGAAIPELATWWVEALTTINDASNQAATNISLAFSSLRAALLGNFGDTSTAATGIWGRMMATLTGQTQGGATGINTLFALLRDNVTGRSNETGINLGTIWGAIRDTLLRRGTESRDGSNNLFGQMRDNLTARASEAVTSVGGWFAGLPGRILEPINKIIDSVLNNGLFKAFNSVVGALGLGDNLKIPTANRVKLAAGGRVPGTSPHAKADNIPAMLTAGEWVQPVDSVQYYGADVMEAIRKKKIPREALLSPIHRAQGGLVELGRRLQAMGAKVTEHPAFGGVAMGGHGKTSLHYTGHAIDVNTRPGTSALEQRELAPMEALARSLGFRTIFMAPDHYNHLHVDDGGGKSILGQLGGLLGGLLSDPVGMLKKAVEDGLGSDFEGRSPVNKIMAMGARKLVDFMAEKVTGWIGNLFDGSDATTGGGLKGNAVANESLVRQMAAARGWTGGEWNALRGLIMKESGFNNTAQNPTSTAYGMFQFLNSTWGGTGIGKTADPRLQTEAGFRYIASRYGSPSRALSFHNGHNWYADGGEVRANQATDGGAIIPDLHDTGGWLQPGLNVIMNRTNRPEPTINPQTLDALQTIAADGRGGSPLLGAYHQTVVSGSPHEAMDELLHTLDVIDLGGRYPGTD